MDNDDRDQSGLSTRPPKLERVGGADSDDLEDVYNASTKVGPAPLSLLDLVREADEAARALRPSVRPAAGQAATSQAGQNDKITTKPPPMDAPTPLEARSTLGERVAGILDAPREEDRPTKRNLDPDATAETPQASDVASVEVEEEPPPSSKAESVPPPKSGEVVAAPAPKPTPLGPAPGGDRSATTLLVRRPSEAPAGGGLTPAAAIILIFAATIALLAALVR